MIDDNVYLIPLTVTYVLYVTHNNKSEISISAGETAVFGINKNLLHVSVGKFTGRNEINGNDQGKIVTNYCGEFSTYSSFISNIST